MGVQFSDLMKLEPHGPDTFVGVGPRYPWGGLYGGQIVAQALRAAGHSVNPEHRVHSLHAYFIRRGDQDTPVRFEVDRIRDGRTFTTRRVVARQSAGAILNMSCSFAVPEGETDVQHHPMPEVPAPEDVERDSGWLELMRRRDVIRDTVGRRAAWFQTAERFGDDPIDHACAIAYFSDDFPCDAVRLRHPSSKDLAPGERGNFWMTSLDHAIWFHHPPRADRWMLHDVQCQSLVGSHGLALGRVFSEDGQHVATFTQEALMRPRRG